MALNRSIWIRDWGIDVIIRRITLYPDKFTLESSTDGMGNHPLKWTNYHDFVFCKSAAFELDFLDVESIVLDIPIWDSDHSVLNDILAPVYTPRRG